MTKTYHPSSKPVGLQDLTWFKASGFADWGLVFFKALRLANPDGLPHVLMKMYYLQATGKLSSTDEGDRGRPKGRGSMHFASGTLHFPTI